jgi:hypothetical protein
VKNFEPEKLSKNSEIRGIGKFSRTVMAFRCRPSNAARFPSFFGTTNNGKLYGETDGSINLATNHRVPVSIRNSLSATEYLKAGMRIGVLSIILIL